LKVVVLGLLRLCTSHLLTALPVTDYDLCMQSVFVDVETYRILPVVNRDDLS